MGSSEVQVFDGDGAVPPELQKLMEENRSLRTSIDNLQADLSCSQSTIEELERSNRFLAKKLRSIGFILDQPMEKPQDDFKDYMNDYEDDDGRTIDECDFEPIQDKMEPDAG